jgi:hypothetical protein
MRSYNLKPLHKAKTRRVVPSLKMKKMNSHIREKTRMKAWMDGCLRKRSSC